MTVTIASSEFRGLRVDVEVRRGEVVDASFAKSGNQLPESMYRRLLNNTRDMFRISCEYENA